MVVPYEGSRDAPGGKLGLRLGEPATNPGPPELRELDSDGVDGVVGLGDDGVVDVNVGVVEGGIRAGAVTTGPGCDETRRQAPRPKLILRCGVSIAM